MKKILAIAGIGILLSGCELLNSITEKVEGVKKMTQTVQELQQNIENTKKELDTKLQEIQDAQEAISKVFGSGNTSNTPEMEALRAQALELQKRLDTLEKQNINHLDDTSEFSIE